MFFDKVIFEKFIFLVYKYVNEIVLCVLLSDWYYIDSGKFVGFKVCFVIGGYWMKVLMDKMQK